MTALTAAAVAKANSTPDPPAWSGRLRSSSPAGMPAQKGHGGNVRGFVEKGEACAKGSPSGDDKNDAAAKAIMAKLGGVGDKKARGVDDNVEILQEQVGGCETMCDARGGEGRIKTRFGCDYCAKRLESFEGCTKITAAVYVLALCFPCDYRKI